MFLTAVVVIIVILTLIRFYEKNTNAFCKSKKRLDRRTAVVTGGTAGMGLEIARDFAARGARVIIACPFPEEGTNAEKTIIKDTGNDKVIFKLLDLGSLDSVRDFADDFLKTEDRLDILVNNAGVGVPKDYLTADGMSFIMQVNYFGHFLLTMLLLPLLKRTGTLSEPSRIVNTSSSAHSSSLLWLGNIEQLKWLSIFSYCNSKMCFIHFSRELTKRLEGSHVVVNSLDPGAVGTRIFDSVGTIIGNVLIVLCNVCFKTPWEGAQTALHLALDSEAGKVSGEFFKNCKLSRAMPWTYNEETAKKVWNDSVRLVKLSEEELNKCLESH